MRSAHHTSRSYQFVGSIRGYTVRHQQDSEQWTRTVNVMVDCFRWMSANETKLFATSNLLTPVIIRKEARS
ncbi:hypothetical protein GQ44DRAFT_701546 [Phaeosphaeriaceae sp. PMI808]|nr:hypothetical protein GQ44DRAFT_701546 [Phaeosphaeriaceae sp. PMI808]